VNPTERAAIRADLADLSLSAYRQFLARALDAADAAEAERDSLRYQVAAARGALNDYRDGYVGSGLAADTLAGLDSLAQPPAVPQSYDRATAQPGDVLTLAEPAGHVGAGCHVWVYCPDRPGDPTPWSHVPPHGYSSWDADHDIPPEAVHVARGGQPVGVPQATNDPPPHAGGAE
jgi:hypothetical protein